MKRPFFLIPYMIFFLAARGGYGQDWSAALTVDPYPSPFLSDWQTDPTMAALEITNPTGKPDVILLDLDVSSGEGARFKGTSQRMLVNPDQTLTMNSTDFNAWYTGALDESVRDKAERTGMMPEGSYQACVTVKNLWGTLLAQNVCAYFTIAHPEPPELIYPAIGQDVAESFPVFQWIPPQMPAARQAVFVFRMVRVMQGQTPEMALAANYPHYENFNVFDSNLEYPLDGLPLEPNATYAWQVQALDFEGKPVTKNDGRSVIGLFTKSAEIDGALSFLQLLSPDDGAVVTAAPEFQWMEPTAGTAGILRYGIKVVQVGQGQTPEQALTRNTPVLSDKNIIGQIRLTYPAEAPALAPGGLYAWQVQARDEYGNPAAAGEGLSQVWTFTAERAEAAMRDILPERLPLAGGSVAYLELKRNGKPAVNYTVSPDSASIAVRGPMTLVLPGMQTGPSAPSLAVDGTLSFNTATLAVESGTITGDSPAQENTAFNLSPAGVPLVVTQVSFRAEQPDRLDLKAVPVLFHRLASNSQVDAALGSDGLFSAVLSAVLSESVPLVPNSDRLMLKLKELSGTLHAAIASGVAGRPLTVEADLAVFTPDLSASIPVSLALGKDGAESRSAVKTQQSLVIGLGSLSLGLTELSCDALRYNASASTWFFDLKFDLAMDFTELGVTLPAVRDVHMSRFGIEIPQISIADLGIKTQRSYRDLWIRPAAFRMYPHTFNWFIWKGGEFGDWGFFWDVEIQLPHLPGHLTAIDQTPFRANNATYTNGAFKGFWNARVFEPALSVPMADSVGWGLAIREIRGSFPQESAEGPMLGVRAKFMPPAWVGADPAREIVFNQDQLSLSPRGIFSGKLESITLSNDIPWGSALSVKPKSAGLTLDGTDGRQDATLGIRGSISIPARSGGTLEAAGEGMFDLFTRRLEAGQFIVQNAFTFGLPWPDYLIGLECKGGAVLDPQGLHVTLGSDAATLSSGDEVSCGTTGDLIIALPDWEPAAGTIRFKETFSLQLSDWSSGRMKWRTLPSSGDAQAGIDNLFLPLPNLPRLDGNALVASGDARAVILFKGRKFALDSEFSNDFIFSMTPTGVRRGRVQFSISDTTVAVLDSSGLHLGGTFGPSGLVSARIGLPDTATAWLDMAANPDLILNDEGGLKRVRGRATVHFPSLKYQSTSIPSIQAQIDIWVDPSTHALSGGTIRASGTPLISLAGGQVPLDIPRLDFTAGQWKASVRPILPMALRPNLLATDSVIVDAGGLRSVDSGFSNFRGAPRDSVVLGPYLTVTLDGIRIIRGGTLPAVSFSGDFKSPAFGGQGIHFTSRLTGDSAAFSIGTLNVETPFGCGSLELKDQDGLPGVDAPMGRSDLVFAVYGVLNLDSLAGGSSLTLPRLEIRGNGITLKQSAAGSPAQSLRLFGSELTVNQFSMTFGSPESYDLVLNGSMKLFGKTVDFTGLHVANGCSVADGVLFRNPSGVRLNPQAALRLLETKSGNLVAGLGVFRPEPFLTSAMDSLKLAINPEGKWLDGGGNPLRERKWTSGEVNASRAPRVPLGNDKFSVNAYLAGVTLAFDGLDNTGDEGSVDYRVDTYWPEKDALGGADSVRIRTDGLFRFNAATATNAWSFSEDAPVDTVTTLLDNDLYMHASDFSMADTAAFQIHFNCVMQLPLPADIFNGQVELLENRLGLGLYEPGRLHTAQIYVAGVTLELLDFHYARNTMVDSKEIEFTQRVASVNDASILADLYLSFGANLSTDFPGFSAGIERFVIFKSRDQFHLLIKHASLWVGEKFFFDLDLIGSIWYGDKSKGEKTQFKWLIGGDLECELGQFKGGTVVGEVSYRETVNLNNQVVLMPGFGLFISANVDVDLKPIPVKLKAFGAGFFFNPSREVRDLVYYHVLGYDEAENQTIRDEFKTVMNSLEDDMMTLWEIYLYGYGVIPQEKTISARILLTLATDRICLNAKVSPDEGMAELKKVIDLSGWIDAQCAWKQDFSGFKYFAGHFKIGGRPATDEKYILKLPEMVQAQTDFIVTRDMKFAISGRLSIETLGSQYLTAECDFTFGNPGFVFSGSVGAGFNMYILRVEAGMGLTTYLKWLEPVKFGISADCYVEGSVISDWLASFRGEMGAALMVEPDLFLYGYAELTGTILGVSKTVRAWAKWEEGGGISAGTGDDPAMNAIVDEAQAVADDIMNSLIDLKAELGMLDVMQYGGFSEEEVRQITRNLSSGLFDQYLKTWDQDYQAFGKVVALEIEKLEKQGYTEKRRQMGAFFDQLINLRNAVTHEGVYPLWRDMKQIEPFLSNLKTSLQNRVDDLKARCDGLAGAMNGIDFALDTLLVPDDAGSSPIQNPLAFSTESVEGVNFPVISLNEAVDNRNKANIEKLQEALEGWLARTESNIQKMRKGRPGIFAQIGPGGPLSKAQEEVSKPLLSANAGFKGAITALNKSFATCYGYYGNIPLPANADEVFTLAAEKDARHRRASIALREVALTQMQVPLINMPVNEVDKYRVLGNLFYRTLPQVTLRYYLKQADSLMLAFENYAGGIQSNLDKVHQNLTANTDLIWDKYAELSEKVYAVIDLYRSSLKNLPGGGRDLVLKDSTKIILSGLEAEFTYPRISPAVTVSKTDGFLPLTLSLDCMSGDPAQISEYAVSLDGGPRQSMGGQSRLDRDYPLRHGVPYWIEKDGGIARPFADTEKKSVKLSPLVRNRAGLSAWANPLRVDMSGKDWWYEPSPNKVVPFMKPDSMYRCIVHWPYPSGQTAGGTVYFCNEKDGLTVRWSLAKNYGLDHTVVPAKHRIEIKRGNKTVFGPEDFPVTQNTLPDTFQARLEGLDLKSGTGEPYRAAVSAYDLGGVLIGTSSGSELVKARKDDGSTYTVSRSWEAPPLYIDSTPPVIAGGAQFLDVGGKRFVIYRLPKAKDEVKIDFGVFSKWISDPAAYEYQLLPPEKNADSSGWKTLAGSDLLTTLPRMTATNQNLHTLADPGSGALSLNFAPAALADSVKLVLRARNAASFWNTGTSAPAVFLIPKADESEAPVPATFQIAGLDANRNLEIRILKAGKDGLSGVSHYTWKLSQNLYRGKIPKVEVRQPESQRFPADSVRDGAILTIRVPHDSIDVNNAMTVEWVTFDHCRNFSVTQREFRPEPPAPILTARLLEGMKPFTLSLSGNFNVLSENYIDTLFVRIGTVPDASDILAAGKSFQQLAKMLNGGAFAWSVGLPASVDEGTSVYLSAVYVRGGVKSKPYAQRVQVYKPVFQTVETDADGYLVLPIVRSAFNGQKEAAGFKWAVGFLAPSLEGQNQYQLTVKPLTALSGVTGEQVGEGKRIKLPIKAGDVRSLSLVVLQAAALDGEIHATYREAAIVPPKPELKADLALDPGDYDRFFYRLKVEAKFGSLLESNFSNSTAKAEILLKAGSAAGKNDIRNLTVPLTASRPGGYTSQEVILDSTLSSMNRIFLTAFSKTSQGAVSKDSTTAVLDVPWPSFSKSPKIDYDGNLTVLPVRPGHRNAGALAGYQFAVGDGEGKTFDLRPYPGNFTTIDVPVSAWQAGKTLTLPFSVLGLANRTCRVGLRAVLRGGQTNEQVLVTKPFLQPKLDASIVEALPRNLLIVRGELGPETAARISRKELNIDLTLNGEIKFSKTLTVPENGTIQAKFDLPDIPGCATYQFKSSFWDKQSEQFATFVTGLDMPCEPMFTAAGADSQDMIFADVLREAFYGNRPLRGYQFALGSGAGKNDVRAFPPEGKFDFEPVQVRAGKRLVLPHSLAGVPSTCFVALKGVDDQGKVQLTEQSFQARPARPAVLGLSMDRKGRFTAEFEKTRIDGKVRWLDFWIRSARDPDLVIAFNQVNASDLLKGKTAFDSGFSERDHLKPEWVLEGTGIGYQINSLDFQYRFRIEKSGDAYRIVVLP